ncbi:biotin/lipoyl-binding protein [Chryseobacterium indologenes]|uniref:HlyD family secretion protein n=1 Tax=Chryseobacterium TaxID=59732 RepID=UPI000485257A|nr:MULTISPECIES: biotin/lipoyl-binding protein [Chryseobacterium]AYZ35239.1 biotin/lipoyl-binding protein [Chryseobacterium indologenes]MBF6643973.1 biotin/lipoyl-binding protein [Chryseobacterium indologenes]MBU3049009.1 biotin/lipoyl-binding protein [Chryseobacterium indologenes]MEB4761431.1 biotin/lipoyl-binding protein [Chryseobacterium indologenes]QQQ72301.1 biotin/lipoyl-binding protein [Chryseobacterium indologenes]
MHKNISLIFAVLFMLGSCGQKNEKLRETEGKTKKDVISFAPKVTGRILKIYVSEGQTVKKGDTLAQLDVPEVSAKIAQAQGAVNAATAQEQMAKNGATADQLRQLNAKYKGLKEQYEFAQKSYRRANNMFRDSLMSPQAHDEVYAKLQGAKAQYDAVVAELDDVKRGTRFEKVEMAAGQASQAKGALQEANVAYSERYIIATNDMEIETISLNTGELATAGFALFNGYIPESTYFRFTIPESAISKYKKGQEVSMQIVYNKEELTGNIVYIKQLTKYADITTAYPDYQLQDAIYEIKVKPKDMNKAKSILVNANVILK